MTGRLRPTTTNAVVRIVWSLFFLAVALVAGALADRSVTYKLHRLDTAVRVPGTVLGLVIRCEAKSTKWAANCWPHLSVRYTDSDGRVRQFLNMSGSTHPKQAPGDTVTVIYIPGDTNHAQIYAPFVEWLTPAAFSVPALVFGIFALVLLAKNVLLWRDRLWLDAHGMHVEAGDITLVRISMSQSRISYRPFVVIAEWRNPRDAANYTFRSDPLYYDPTAAVRSRPTIGVLIDADRPRRYWMEIGLLARPLA